MAVTWLQCSIGTRGCICKITPDTRTAGYILSGSELKQTQAGESYIVNKAAAQNSPEHLQPWKRGNGSI